MKKRKSMSLGSPAKTHTIKALHDLSYARSYARHALRSTKTSCLDAAEYMQNAAEYRGKGLAELRHTKSAVAEKAARGAGLWLRGAQEAFVRRCVGRR